MSLATFDFGTLGCLLVLSAALSVLFSTCGCAPAAPEITRNKLLPPGPGNPRNSEGDFIELKDGRILFVYTHFTGSNDDNAAAHLALASFRRRRKDLVGQGRDRFARRVRRRREHDVQFAASPARRPDRPVLPAQGPDTPVAVRRLGAPWTAAR